MKKIILLFMLVFAVASTYSQTYQFNAIIDSSATANGVQVGTQHSYDIITLNTVPNREGVDEIFYSISIFDDLGVYNFGKWMTVSEKALYDSDNANLPTIIQKYLRLARNNYLKQE